MLMDRFQPGQSIPFENLFDEATTKAEVIVTFLAVLELMKMNQFIIRQNSILGEIQIERRVAGSSTAAELLGAMEE